MRVCAAEEAATNAVRTGTNRSLEASEEYGIRVMPRERQWRCHPNPSTFSRVYPHMSTGVDSPAGIRGVTGVTLWSEGGTTRAAERPRGGALQPRRADLPGAART